jgi:hypothetical protein
VNRPCSGCDWGCYAVAVVALLSCTGTELDKRMLRFRLKDRSLVVLIVCAFALSQSLGPSDCEIIVHTLRAHCIHLVIL